MARTTRSSSSGSRYSSSTRSRSSTSSSKKSMELEKSVSMALTDRRTNASLGTSKVMAIRRRATTRNYMIKRRLLRLSSCLLWSTQASILAKVLRGRTSSFGGSMSSSFASMGMESSSSSSTSPAFGGDYTSSPKSLLEVQKNKVTRRNPPLDLSNLLGFSTYGGGAKHDDLKMRELFGGKLPSSSKEDGSGQEWPSITREVAIDKEYVGRNWGGLTLIVEPRDSQIGPNQVDLLVGLLQKATSEDKEDAIVYGSEGGRIDVLKSSSSSSLED
ncbi:unnamed protein product, partial [Amoebophrya sp. A25]|eukprot:GSA25T00019111001.1